MELEEDLLDEWCDPMEVILLSGMVYDGLRIVHNCFQCPICFHGYRSKDAAQCHFRKEHPHLRVDRVSFMRRDMSIFFV